MTSAKSTQTAEADPQTRIVKHGQELVGHFYRERDRLRSQYALRRFALSAAD